MNPEKVLPPGVNGRVSGHLKLDVDEIFWTRNSPGEVYVELLWWGEKESTIFKPEDITHKNENKTEDTSVIYSIRTSPGLFESYLRNCGKLTFKILRGQNKNVVIGSTVVKDMEKIISEKNYHSYFPIFSPKGLRLGDIHICFDIKFKLKQSNFTVNRSSKPDLIRPKDFRHQLPALSKPSSKSSTVISHEDKILYDTFEKASDLRKSMVMSVLADCPVNEIETVFNSNTDKLPGTKNPMRREPKLVDYLLGKDMTPEEESRALQALRCISPDENLLSIAESSSVKPKVKKSTCCLHGKKCTKKKTIKGLRTPSVPVDTLVTQQTSQSSDQQLEELPSDEKIKDEEPPPLVYNCYELLIRTLNLTHEGSRKIYYAPVMNDPELPKSNSNPPGTYFTLEIFLPRKGPWARKLKFSTKAYKDKSVLFSQGTTHKLCGSVTWARVIYYLEGSEFTVFWRHLNQRLPCPLGSCRLQSLKATDNDEMHLILPLYSNTKLLTGHLDVCIRLSHTSRKGGEALYHLKDSVEVASSDNPSDIPNNKPYSDPKRPESHEIINPEPVILSSGASVPASSSSSDDANAYEPSPRSLDDELLNTINLLNSKSDKKHEEPAPSAPKTDVVSKQEACVQTTLPIEVPNCPTCGCSANRNEKPANRKIFRELNTNSEPCAKPISSCNSHNQVPSKPTLEPFGEHTLLNDNVHEPIQENVCMNKQFQPQDLNIPEKPNYPSMEVGGMEKIHEYTIKIEKLVGVPLFNGDCDFDCYVDYSFPKVNSSGRLMFDNDVEGTEVKIALKQTEFKTILRHRLRLGCKLTRALLSLPTHSITFRLWGRFYTPTPQDYKLGKALLPLAKLSALELKYEQQSEKHPVIEKFILPISVLETPMTSGYNGPFGEMHLTIIYSNASGLSYREWRCKTKDDHYWCRARLIGNKQSSKNPMSNDMDYECPKAKLEFYGAGDSDKTCRLRKEDGTHEPLSDIKKHEENTDINYERQCFYNEPTGRFVNSNINFSARMAQPLRDVGVIGGITNKFDRRENYFQQANSTSNLPKYANNYYETLPINADDYPSDLKKTRYFDKAIVQTNLNDDVIQRGFRSELPIGKDNSDLHDRLDKDGVRSKVIRDMKSRLQPVGESSRGETRADIHPPNVNLYSKEFQENAEQLVSGRRENIVEKVLKDIKERKNQARKKSTYTVQKNKTENVDESDPFGMNNDAMESFNLKSDLPSCDDFSDFEVNSQYSFLKTPPPVESTFPCNNSNDFETNSSKSIKERVQNDRLFNPFTSQSHLSLTLNSESSMFRPVDEIKPVEAPKLPTKSTEVSLREHEKCAVMSISNNNHEELKQCKATRAKTYTKSKNHKSNSNVEPNEISSDETLKSVESLKSFKEECLPRQSKDVAVGTNFDVTNKDTQTSHKDKEYFKARVEISRALGLPSLEVKQSNGKVELMKPTSHAYFSAIYNGKETILKTPVIEKTCNPVWNSSWDVYLSTDFLMKTDRELEIFVDLSGDSDDTPVRVSDVSIHWPIGLRTGVDLTSVTAGLESASGWFSLSDRAHLSRAQIKVAVTPLEDISQFRQDWVREYTKSKSKRSDFSFPQKSSSIATSLQEKLMELEHLTQRMKKKLDNRSQWDDSPPLSLLEEVQKKSLTSIQNVAGTSRKRKEKVSKTAEIATNPIVHKEKQDISTIVISDDDAGDENDKGSGDIKTYTISESSSEEDKSSHEDSLETPSQTIDRILNRVRSSR